MPRDAFFIYVDDWLSSGRIELMDAHEERGYFRLLLRAWKQPDCALPTDDLTLASWSRMGTQWFRETADRNLRADGVTSGSKVRACFQEANGRLFNVRQHKEWDYQQNVWAKRIANGKRGGRPKKEPNDNLDETTRLSLGSEGESIRFRDQNQTETNLNLNLNQYKEQAPQTASTPDSQTEETPVKVKRATLFSLTEMPDDWALFAQTKRGWNRAQAQEVFELFSYHWNGKAGKEATKRNWYATWCGWVVRENKQTGLGFGKPQQSVPSPYRPWVDPYKGQKAEPFNE